MPITHGKPPPDRYVMIDEDLQIRLREKYNPDGSSLRQHQLALLEMLEYVDDICRRHNIRYWLSSGTLLGAYRHGGFIPWDDDLDVEMLDGDYMRFIEVMKHEESDKYVLQTQESDPGAFVSFAKLRELNTLCKESNGWDRHMKYQGRFIDIFHLFPSSSIWIHRIVKKIFGVEIRIKVYCHNRKLLNKCTHAVLYKVVYPVLRRIAMINAKDLLRHYIPTTFVAARSLNEIFPLSEISFEGKPFPAPGNVEAYLNRMFDNDLSIPSPDKILIHLKSE